MNKAAQGGMMLALGLAGGVLSRALPASFGRSSEASDLNKTENQAQTQQALEELRNQLSERLALQEANWSEQVEQLRNDMRVRQPVSALNTGDLDQALSRWMEENGSGLMASNLEGDDSAASGGDQAKADALMQRLRDPQLTTDELSTLWFELKALGLQDEALAHFKEAAAQNPNDAKAQVDLGMALIYKLNDVSDGPEKGMVATQADRAFDRALEIDDQHWEARFSKAISLSFWPPFLGKQAEAIEHFEVLRTQQDGASTNSSYAQTYLLLGNLYREAGEFEKAKSVWQEGLGIFPDSQELQQQLAALD